MNDTGPVRGVIVAHASLAQALVRAAQRVAGADQDSLRWLSNEERGPEALERAVRETAGQGPVVLFTDLPSGSCTFAARKVFAGRDDVAVICGVNLPVLVDFLFHRDLPLDELVERLIEKGRAGLTGACKESERRADSSAAR
ncbi:MAG: PTS sugar transporter subunit IIA [Longimicrobiaceae bacterium]